VKYRDYLVALESGYRVRLRSRPRKDQREASLGPIRRGMALGPSVLAVETSEDGMDSRRSRVS
jgi:hypothetical protein